MSDLTKDKSAEESGEQFDSLARLLSRGGVYHNALGSSRDDVLANLIGGLPLLSARKREALLQAVIEREALVSTGVENGIALPHPRVPILEGDEEPFVTIAFPLEPLDWPTPDGSAVGVIFLIVSKSPKQHLGVLSKINFLCQQKDFFNLISARAPKEEITAAVEEAEKYWR